MRWSTFETDHAASNSHCGYENPQEPLKFNQAFGVIVG